MSIMFFMLDIIDIFHLIASFFSSSYFCFVKLLEQRPRTGRGRNTKYKNHGYKRINSDNTECVNHYWCK